MPDVMNFDATGIAPRTVFDTIPAGWYRAWITDSEMKPTAKGGEYLQLVWEILDGEHKGRKVWDRLNVKNANAKAQEIAQESLSAICHAIGVMKISNTGQLHGKACLIKLEVKTGQPKKDVQGNVMKDEAGNVVMYDPSNEVKGYRAATAAPSPTVVSGAERSPALKDEDDSDLPF
jgi:hypothetical protein